ncbi:MAG: DNA-binding response regulator [Ilumatobacteraceae bacterium]|nr:DNA-binding response regulator [Ilumatobacteraceae bacterium]
MKQAAVIDNWALVRLGVETALRRSGIATVQSMPSVTGVLSTEQRIDLVVVGQITDMNQGAAVRRLAQLGVGIIVLASSVSPGAVMDLCAEGANAVVSRDAGDADFEPAIAAALEGRRHVAPDLLDAMFSAKLPTSTRQHFDLTVREREVLVELAAGRTNSEISQRLLIGTETVKSHLNNIYDKLDVRRRTHAVSLALAAGLV